MWGWMKPRLSTVYGLPTTKWDEVAAASEWNLQAVIPWMEAQLAGMAAGSGLPMRDLLLMNNYGLIWSNDGNWRSSVAVKETEEGPLLGQNLDLGSEDFYYLEEVHADGAPAVLCERMVGMCHSCCGINAAGLAVASSNLSSPGQRREPWKWSAGGWGTTNRIPMAWRARTASAPSGASSETRRPRASGCAGCSSTTMATAASAAPTSAVIPA